jgi:hypothetical protein
VTPPAPSKGAPHTHRGVNRTSRRGSSRSAEEPWTEGDAIILLAAAALSPAADLQNYDERRPWVREIADFLGRSPASISFHLGNIASAKSPGHGLTHAGKVFEIVVDRYRDNPGELQLEAARLRRAKFGKLTSPRLERDLPEDEALAAESELERRFPEARLPPGSIILYRYKGSVWLGVMATIQTALVFPQETANLFRVALDVLGSAAKRNTAAECALDGRTIELAEREIVSRAPKFHYSELEPNDRVTLALRLPGLRSLRRWRAHARRLEFFSSPDLREERARIQTYFRIDASKLCVTCVQMLLDALENALATGKI